MILFLTIPYIETHGCFIITGFYRCPASRQRNSFKSTATDHVELERDRGERIQVQCEYFLERQQIHVNYVKAEPSKFILALSGYQPVA